MYKRIPEAAYSYVYCTTVKKYLLNLLGNAEVADVITPYINQLTNLLSEPACRLIQPIQMDYNFIEVEDEYLFDIANKKFTKDNEKLKGSPRAYVRYSYSEDENPKRI